MSDLTINKPYDSTIVKVTPRKKVNMKDKIWEFFDGFFKLSILIDNLFMNFYE